MTTTSSRAPGAGAASLNVDVAVVGAGPAGLMAAETLAGAGIAVTLFERMPSPARKLLMAGRGGLNLTHSEPLETFLTRYRPHHTGLLEAVRAFPPEALVAWAGELGIETFTGSSGRIATHPIAPPLASRAINTAPPGDA